MSAGSTMAALPRSYSVTVYELDPLQDARWPLFLERHEQASVFQSPEWLGALRQTYGYRPVVLTTAGPGASLRNALVFCRVQSWLTGPRVVALPFSDHCTPLVENPQELAYLLGHLRQDETRRRYIELRCLSTAQIAVPAWAVSESFCLHRLNLMPSCEELYQRFHPSHVRRKIARAEREELTYEEGTSEKLLQQFYRLAVVTRRRHRLPPQPLAWFRNLILCLGNRIKIRLLSHRGQPAAATMMLQYKKTLTYKYGFSDANYHRLGSMQLLLWKAIQEAKRQGLVEFDMGRSNWNNPGLIAFKDHWGAARSSILHLREPAEHVVHRHTDLLRRVAQQAFAIAPDIVLMKAGDLLYRHMG